jgi:hypothetical protein
MITVTGSEALSYARVELLRLAARAMETSEPDREYICQLADSWANRLAEMSRAASPGHVSEESWRVLDRLTSTINNPALTGDALVEWVDAFPEAVTDLLANKAVEAVPAPVLPVRRSGNNQSTLALAA